jgi:hypothetical protein
MSLRKEINDENLITEEAVKSYPKVTRVEVIDSNGRAYTTWEAADVVTILQDDERTLKVFLRNTDA